MKKMIKVALFLMLGFTPCFATQVDIKLQTQTHNGTKGGARMPALIPTITVDISNSIVTTSITRYSGIVYIYVCDNDGNIVSDCYLDITNDTPQIFSLGLLDEGEYIIHYNIGSMHFVGEFSI